MKDTTFYQSLWYCKVHIENCKSCPLYAQGHRESNECQRMLAEEIRTRKNKVLFEEETEDESNE